MAEVVINLRDNERFEAGSVLLSYLAFPLGREAKAREQHAIALCHAILRYRAKRDPDWASAPQLIKPQYAFVSPDQFNKGVRQSMRRIRDRSIAGRMAIGPLTQAIAGRAPELPRSMTRLSLSQLAEYFLAESGETEPANVLKRAWSQSKPVIHLASAIEIYRRMAQDQGWPGLAADVQHVPGAIEIVLDLAADHERVIPSIPLFATKADQLIRFRLVGPVQK